MDTLPQLKFCGGPCQKQKPIEAFARQSDKPDGRKPWCKQCLKERKLAQKKKQLDYALEHIDERALATLSQAKPGGTNLPHQVQALESIMSLIGGVQGFALLFAANMAATNPGSETRSRILNKVLSAIQLCSDDAKVAKPRHLMSDEELDAAINERMNRLRIHQVIEPESVRESA